MTREPKAGPGCSYSAFHRTLTHNSRTWSGVDVCARACVCVCACVDTRAGYYPVRE